MKLPRRLALFGGLPIVVGILLAPYPESMSANAHRTLAIALLMALWWITEAVPIPVTALIPLIAFPLLQIEKIADVAKSYGDSNIFLFMGGFFIAMAMQKWELHRRLALHVIRRMGVGPGRIVLGFMVATALISMWISNTATTMMMYPIGLAIIVHIQELAQSENTFIPPQSLTNFRTTLMLAIAYAASIGGVGTLIGTPPNIVFTAMLKSIFPASPEIGFVQWLGIGFPLVILFLPITWYLLTRVMMPIRLKELPGGMAVVNEKIQELGPMRAGERWTLIIFLLAALGWIFRQDIDFGTWTMPGWASLIGVEKFADDAVVAMTATLLLFLIPVDLKKGEFLLDWKTAVKIPWGILLLFGGGIALANGFRSSGLAEWIGLKLELIAHFPLIWMVVAVCFMLTFLTEVTSNTAIATLFMPILAATALSMHTNPMVLMIPATISASFAFMMPVATPPNAIIFASGYVTVPQMARVGLVLNLIGIVLVTALIYLVAIPLFGIQVGTLPAWIKTF